MAERVETGGTVRENLEAAARMGSRRAKRELVAPPFPDSLRHLWRWGRALHGRSGVGPHGLAPLSYREVAAWAQLSGERPTPYEVEALMDLDAAMLAPPKPEKSDG